MSPIIFWPMHLKLGPIELMPSILTSEFITLFLFIMVYISYRTISSKPKRLQICLEGIYLAMYQAVSDVLPEQTTQIFPFIATLWIFILISNLIGIIPGFQSPTADISITSCLAILTFFSVHWFGIQAEGFKNYFRHYLRPSPFLLPFHLMSEISRTVALAIRLFGNIMSLEITALIVLMVTGFLAPIPILLLHIVEAIIQAYIFGMLALIYIAGGIQIQIKRREQEVLRG